MDKYNIHVERIDHRDLWINIPKIHFDKSDEICEEELRQILTQHIRGI